MSGASIETRHGFEPFEEPVGTPGVDRACLGPGDLSFVETAEPWISLGTLILATTDECAFIRKFAARLIRDDRRFAKG